jgi:hypothetical protein
MSFLGRSARPPQGALRLWRAGSGSGRRQPPGAAKLAGGKSFPFILVTAMEPPRQFGNKPREVWSKSRQVGRKPRRFWSQPRGAWKKPRRFEAQPRELCSKPRGANSKTRGVWSRPRQAASKTPEVWSLPRGVWSKTRENEAMARRVTFRVRRSAPPWPRRAQEFRHPPDGRAGKRHRSGRRSPWVRRFPDRAGSSASWFRRGN